MSSLGDIDQAERKGRTHSKKWKKKERGRGWVSEGSQNVATPGASQGVAQCIGQKG